MSADDGGPVAETLPAANAELQQAMLALRSLMSRLASSEVERSVVLEALARLELDGEIGPEARVTVDDAANLLAHAALDERA
jgi:prefoldin subunit 5